MFIQSLWYAYIQICRMYLHIFYNEVSISVICKTLVYFSFWKPNIKILMTSQNSCVIGDTNTKYILSIIYTYIYIGMIHVIMQTKLQRCIKRCELRIRIIARRNYIVIVKLRKYCM